MANPDDGRRRSSVRTATIGQIKRAALKQLDEHGIEGVQIRAIARDVGLVPSALYRYYPSREALLNALAVDAATEMAQNMAAARDAAPLDDYGSRWRALCNAYRDWAVAHPQEYALVFATDWSADQATARHLLAVPTDEYAQAVDRGATEKSTRHGDTPESDLLNSLLHEQPTLNRDEAAALVNAWASVHGFVSLDTQGSVFTSAGTADGMFERHITTVMDGLGYRQHS